MSHVHSRDRSIADTAIDTIDANDHEVDLSERLLGRIAAPPSPPRDHRRRYHLAA